MSLVGEGAELAGHRASSVDRGPSIASVGDYVALMKPRVMSLVVFTALVGIMIAPGHLHLPHRNHIIALTFAVVAFSIFAQGLTITPLMRRLGALPAAEGAPQAAANASVSSSGRVQQHSPTGD